MCKSVLDPCIERNAVCGYILCRHVCHLWVSLWVIIRVCVVRVGVGTLPTVGVGRQRCVCSGVVGQGRPTCFGRGAPVCDTHTHECVDRQV